MGSCAGGHEDRYRLFPKETMERIHKIISNEEMFILHLIYNDLAVRIAKHKINLENFMLFFNKNGFWGERLFKEFDYDESNLINEVEFICGIAQIFKSTQKEKIELLYKFFAKNRHKHEGVFFTEFLTMLYNYPKQDLNSILNDKQFINSELKKCLVPVENNDNNNHTYRLQSTTLPKGIVRKQEGRSYRRRQNRQNGNGSTTGSPIKDTEGPVSLHSMIGKDVLKHVKCKLNEKNVIRLGSGEQVYNIQTINIQQLVKKYAQQVFAQCKVDQNQGTLNFDQFHNWIITHQALYENYYHGFHPSIWQVDPVTKKPKYLTSECQIVSQGKMKIQGNLMNVRLFLINSVLVVAEIRSLGHPLHIICLQGLSVGRVFDQNNGFGFEITHTDGLYPEKQFYLKNQNVMSNWMELLKYYRGQTVHQKYDIGAKIGTGKFSIVYKCIHNQQQVQYALKEIATFKLDHQSKQLISHQRIIMQVISHPLLLQFKECITTPTHIYIITQLVNGKDLFDYVNSKGHLSEKQAGRIFQQIVVGIRFLHSFDIVHRDLKPENIMVVTDQNTQEVSSIKIIDFGFSNYISKIEEQTTQENLVGTPNYIAPEVLLEEPYDFKIDNFAIGVILYFMLIGNLPFNACTIPKILENTISGVFAFSPKIPISAQAQDLISKLLNKDHKQRISLEETLKHSWFKKLKIVDNFQTQLTKQKSN